jgi:hypothetical protein
MAEKVLSREEIEKRAIEKAWKDEGFKKELTAKPHQALSQLGVSVPEKIDIKVVEEPAKVLYLVLPVNPESELTDGSLDSVAGGECKSHCPIDLLPHRS